MTRQNHVLVVEDDKSLNKLVCQCVRLAGYPAQPALDGASALEAALREPPALVLLDLMLPDTTGFEVCVEIKRNERTKASHVVMVTAMDDDESRQRGLACGAVKYLVKPFDPAELIETIKKYAA